MEEDIFDLQTEILNLITSHHLENGEYAFIYRDQKLMIMDLTQKTIVDAVKEKTNKVLQETK
jgi:hypothetical protein